MATTVWLLELLLAGLLVATLVHAVRLQRAVAALQRERSTLGEAMAGFDTTTRDAEAGLGRLHQMAQGVAGQVAGRVEAATVVSEDLRFLTERGEQLADRLEALVRAARPAPDARADARADGTRLQSQAERDLLQALKGAR